MSRLTDPTTDTHRRAAQNPGVHKYEYLCTQCKGWYPVAAFVPFTKMDRYYNHNQCFRAPCAACQCLKNGYALHEAEILAPLPTDEERQCASYLMTQFEYMSLTSRTKASLSQHDKDRLAVIKPQWLSIKGSRDKATLLKVRPYVTYHLWKRPTPSGFAKPGAVEKVRDAKRLMHQNAAAKELAARELARRNLIEYTRRFMPEYDAGWVHHLIAAELKKFSEEVAEGKSPRLMISMPPRHGKSMLASDMFPSWHLGRNPEHQIIVASYAESLPLDFSRNVRDRLGDTIFKQLFDGVTVHPNYQNATGWRTNKNGAFYPVGVGGPLTGRGANILLIDDPIKNQEEAESEVTLASIQKWYESTAYTRLMPGGGVLIIQTRWADDDLSGWLESKAAKGEGDEWRIIKLPALATTDEPYRKKGEPLHPERYPKDSLERIKRAVGPRTWAALYQQDPVPEDGSFVGRNDFKFYDPEDLPDHLHVYQAWDLAIGTKQQNDWTVGLCWGIDAFEDIYILDLVRGRWGAFEIVERMVNFWGLHKARTVGIEEGVISKTLKPLLDKRIAERKAWAFHYEPLKPGRSDKLARARSIQGRMQQGKVKFPREAEWLEVLMNELLRFPFGKHDDCVDVMAYCGLMMGSQVAPSLLAPSPKKDSWVNKLILPGSPSGGSFMSA